MLCPCVYVWINVSVFLIVCECAANHKDLLQAVESNVHALFSVMQQVAERTEQSLHKKQY